MSSLRLAVSVFERLGLRYLVTGSLATVFYGEPRFTNDIDIVVDLPAKRVVELCAAFPSPEFYVSPESALRAVAKKGQFNVIHPASGLKRRPHRPRGHGIQPQPPRPLQERPSRARLCRLLRLARGRDPDEAGLPPEGRL